MIKQPKIKDSFSDSQFYIDEYITPYRFDRNKYLGDIMVFERNGFVSKLFSINKLLAETLLVELYLSGFIIAPTFLWCKR